MAEKEALTGLIAAVDKNADAASAAEALLKDIAMSGRAFELDAGDICARAGISRSAAEAIDLIDELTRYADTEAPGGSNLTKEDAACRYFTALLRGRHVEHFYAAYLDKSGRLLRTVLIGRGGFDSSPACVRDVADCAMKSGAFSVLLAHNHPGGTAAPSEQDIAVTRKAAAALCSIGVKLIEHYIVTSGGITGIIGKGYLK